MQLIRVLLLHALVVVGSVSTLAQSPRPMTETDQFAVTTLREVAVSPNGKTALFTAMETNLDQKRSTTRLWRVASDGGKPVEVNGAPTGASSIRWSPDGTRVAFFAAPDGRLGLYVLQLATRQLTRVCDYDRSNAFISKSGNALAWAPDGRRLAFAGTTESKPEPGDPIVITRLQYKSRTDLSDNRRSHIHIVSVAGGAPKPITTGDYDEHSIDWGGDGTEIVFLSNRQADPDATHNYDIYAVNASSGVVRQITDTPGVEMDPHVSPDGRLIAYTATTRPLTTIDSVAEDAHLWVTPTTGGDARELNHAQDRRASGPMWMPGGHDVLYSVRDRGRTTLHQVAASGGDPVTVLERDAQIGPYPVGESGTIVFGMTNPSMPRELFGLTTDSAEPERLSHLNDETLAAWQLVEPETVEFESVDGTPVQGWLYPALGSEPSDPTPMILSIHGGPHGMYGYSFNAGFQINAARGYATLAINPRGSSGYGQTFADGCVNNWGGGDYQDLMAGVDHVLATHPTIDADRLGVMGGSYGGFMTNWVITQTDRFKAAVSSASVSNLISFYATSLYQDLVHAEFSGFPWDGNFELLWKWSPLAHVKNVTTPTLFVHGERDNDVHITQAEEMYTALRRRGVTATLVRYPREGHGLRELGHRLDRTRRTLEWMDEFVKEDP